MKTYNVTLHGDTPLLMHQDNIEWADEMERWKNNPENKRFSVAGDDRSPAWRWVGSLYHDGTHVGIANDAFMRSLMEGATQVLVPGGRGGKTFKSQSQSGIQLEEPFLRFTVGGRVVPVKPLTALVGEMAFHRHQEVVADLGFSLYVKRAKVGQAKHIRVRPRFDSWEAVGTVNVIDEQITREVLTQMLVAAGRYKGLGDWRPSAPKAPGPHGRFNVELEAA